MKQIITGQIALPVDETINIKQVNDRYTHKAEKKKWNQRRVKLNTI